MSLSCAGIILAGGANSRMAGENKAFLRVRGTKIIDRVYSVFREIFSEIVLVTNEPLRYLEYDLMIATDIFSARSSLTGIHAGLRSMRSENAFFAACDGPFVKREIIETVVENAGPGYDVVIPETSAGFEPLCAVYSKRCLNTIENNLRLNKFRIRQVFKSMRVKKLDEKILRAKDPELLSFFNINTSDDLERAEELASRMNQRGENGSGQTD